MKRFLLLPLLAGALLATPAHAALRVVTTLPDLAAIARAVGGDHLEVTSLALPTEDPHYVDPKPSFIRTLNRADVLIQGGAELEIGWLPPLVQRARNPKILPGREANIDASQGLKLLNVPTGPIDRSQGDVHPSGNPHYLLDPANAQAFARSLAGRLAGLDPDHAADYRSNAEGFARELDEKLKEWKQAFAPSKGAKVITYHKSYDYFLDCFGLVLAGTIEPKPGVEPSPSHITRLIQDAKPAAVRLVIMEPFRSPRTPSYVAETIGAKLVALPLFPGAHADTASYTDWMDHLVSQTVANLKPAP